MAEGEKELRETIGRSSRELQNLVLHKVGEMSSAIEAAKQVDEVICALYSLAVRLFPVDSSAVCGAVAEHYRSQVIATLLPSDAERSQWIHIFYHGAAFPVVSKILIYDIATKWLERFPLSAKNQVYDSFFSKGLLTEVVQALVPAMKHDDNNATYSNIERLLALCLLENKGVHQIFRELRQSRNGNPGDDIKPENLSIISRVAQLLVSIPDKARLRASRALKSHLFFEQITIQLLAAAEESDLNLTSKGDASDANFLDEAFLFVGETFSRICRRGSTDILLLKMVPRIVDHVRSCLSVNAGSFTPNAIEYSHKSWFWISMMETVKDQYSVERLCEGLLRQLTTQNVSDIEGYWILWLLFHRTVKQKSAMRAMFVDKFLFWKVFPLSCLRWILHFSVFEYPPDADNQIGVVNKPSFLDMVHRLVSIWSRREFIQSSSMEQQAYITAAVGLCIEKMSKQELETTKDLLHSILQGVSCRLESPIDSVRKMASSIALAFSKVVDPKNPLYLDDNCSETIDWEFGLISKRKEQAVISQVNKDEFETSLDKELKNGSQTRRKNGVKLVRAVQEDVNVEEDNVDGEDSDASSDSSLQPYDLSDDDADLQQKFTQLADVAAALRKPDDSDGVERALDIAEKLVRAVPDELCHNSTDLVRALVHVRCTDIAVEGEEDSAEAKRQKALVALLVTCPFESLDVLTKLIYSPNVDVGQRIMVLDVMTEAAQELSESTIIRRNYQQRNLISTIGGQPWFVPNNRGPSGAGPWKEISEPGTSVSWSHRYEREIPSKPGQIKYGKSRKWGIAKAKDPQLESTRNRFPLYAAAFMLPMMQGFDKKRHGVDLLNRDFIVLGKLIYMLGVCMKCITMHPEASDLAPALLDMLRSREISNHAEAYVRRSALFAASCILVALHPSHVAAALIEGNQDISTGLEWIRTWTLHVAESDPDTECSSMAMTCLQLHAEMALQTSRALESAENSKAQKSMVPPKLDKIIIPFSSTSYKL